jgi:hypothetical protein
LDAVDDTGGGLHIISFHGSLIRGRTGHLGAGCRSVFTTTAGVAPIARKEGFTGTVDIAIISITGIAWLTSHQGTGRNSRISTRAGIASIGCDERISGVYLKAIDETVLGFHILRLGSHVLFRGAKHSSAGRQTVHVAARAGVATVQGSILLADAEHTVDSFAGGHVRLPILSGAYLGTGLELAVLRGISVDESAIAAIEYVHGACQLFLWTGAEGTAIGGIAGYEAAVAALSHIRSACDFLWTGGELAVVGGISVDERSVFALFDIELACAG